MDSLETSVNQIRLSLQMHLRSENASQTEPLKMLVSYVIKKCEPNVKAL